MLHRDVPHPASLLEAAPKRFSSYDVSIEEPDTGDGDPVRHLFAESDFSFLSLTDPNSLVGGSNGWVELREDPNAKMRPGYGVVCIKTPASWRSCTFTQVERQMRIPHHFIACNFHVQFAPKLCSRGIKQDLTRFIYASCTQKCHP